MTGDEPREAIAGWVWVGLGGLASLLVPLWLLLSASLLQLEQFGAVSLGQPAEAPMSGDWLHALQGAATALLLAIPLGLVLGTGAALSRVASERRQMHERETLDAATSADAVIGAKVVTRGREAAGGPRSAVVLADIPSRVLAWLVDRGLLLVASMPLLLFNPAVRPALDRPLSGGGGVVANVLLVLSAIILAALTVAQLYGLSRYGQSIGKRWFSIRIVRADGRVPGLLHSLVLRELVLAGLMLATFFAFVSLSGALAAILALMWPVLDALTWFGPVHRALHDQWADTLVVRTSLSGTSHP